MISAKQFLEETLSNIENQQKLQRFYLYNMTKKIDRTFIIDLNKIKVKVLPLQTVFNEMLNFINYVVFHKEEASLNSAFIDYLRLAKSKDFIRHKIWSILYSFEILKTSNEELWMQANMLSSSVKPLGVLTFYVFCRKSIIQVTQCNEKKILDNVLINYDQLDRIMKKIFGGKASTKVHLFKNLSSEMTASEILSQILIDWLKQQKNKLQPRHQRKLNKSHSNIKTKLSRSPLSKKNKNQKTKSQVYLRSKKTLDQSISHTLENLQKQKMYLVKVQDETNVKIKRLNKIENDLIEEYNKLLFKGQKIYQNFFDVYYKLQLQKQHKMNKLPFSKNDIEEIKKILKFKKIIPKSNEIKESRNPLYDIIQCDQKNKKFKNPSKNQQ